MNQRSVIKVNFNLVCALRVIVKTEVTDQSHVGNRNQITNRQLFFICCQTPVPHEDPEIDNEQCRCFGYPACSWICPSSLPVVRLLRTAGTPWRLRGLDPRFGPLVSEGELHTRNYVTWFKWDSTGSNGTLQSHYGQKSAKMPPFVTKIDH